MTKVKEVNEQSILLITILGGECDGDYYLIITKEFSAMKDEHECQGRINISYLCTKKLRNQSSVLSM